MDTDSTDEEQEEDKAAWVDLECGWEPPCPSTAHATIDDDPQHYIEQTSLRNIREEAEDHFCTDPIVVSYPQGWRDCTGQ